MTMDRHTHRLTAEILTVLERYGHHARDREHADQAIAMITDLVGIYDGTLGIPASTGRHAAPGPDVKTPGPDSLVLTGDDLSAAFAALDMSAEYKRYLVEICPDCADKSCETCQVRDRDAEAFDRLADRILQHQLAVRSASHGQPEPDGPGSPGRSPGPADPDAGKEAGQ